jgi:hypothetical protein
MNWFHIKGVPRIEAGVGTGFIGTGININEDKKRRLSSCNLEHATGIAVEANA